MATDSEVTEESEALNCPVCITKFDNPRILPCLHTICEKCLRVNIESQGKSSTQFTCPICRSPTLPSETGVAVDKLINEFIPDSILKSLVDTTESADNKDDQCEICKRGGKNISAEVWCWDCKEKLCGPCVKYHSRSKSSLNHKMVLLDEIENQRLAFSYERTCARHPGKPLELFCVDHREVCCVLCFAYNHRGCNDAPRIDDIVKEEAKGFAYNKVLEVLMETKKEMNKVIKDNNDNVIQLAQEKEKMINKIDSTLDLIVEKLSELRKSFRDKAGHLHDGGKLSLSKYQKAIRGFLSNIINSCVLLEGVNESGSPRQKFVIFETIRSQIITHHQQLKNDLEDNTEVHLTLKQNNVLQNIEKALENVDVMEVTMKPNKVMKDSLNNIDDNIKKLSLHTQLGKPMCAAQVERSDMMTLTKTMTRQNLGKCTFITGGTCLMNGRLIMADNGNRRLLELDDDYNIVREHKLDGYPGDVAVGNKQNEIYISLYNSIYRCTLDTCLEITQRFKVPGATWGIALSGDTLIAAAPDVVMLISQDGITINSLSTSRDFYKYVAVSRTLPSFYRSDGHCVVSHTFDGNELFRYSNDNLKKVTGICVHNNNVYVCGGDSHNIHVISCDGQRSRVLLERLHSITKPHAVVFNQQKNELIITSWGQDTVFEVYKLT